MLLQYQMQSYHMQDPLIYNRTEWQHQDYICLLSQLLLHLFLWGRHFLFCLNTSTISVIQEYAFIQTRIFRLFFYPSKQVIRCIRSWCHYNIWIWFCKIGVKSSRIFLPANNFFIALIESCTRFLYTIIVFILAKNKDLVTHSSMILPNYYFLWHYHYKIFSDTDVLVLRIFITQQFMSFF